MVLLTHDTKSLDANRQSKLVTFPPSVHAKLSPRSYLTAHLHSSTRPSGRSPTQSRALTLHTGSLTHPHGSAVIRIGDTAVVCGVRGEVLKAADVVHWSYKRRPRRKSSSNHDLLNFASSRSEQRNAGRINDKAVYDDRNEREELMQLGLLVPNVELNTGCSPEYLPGGPPSVAAQVLTQRLLTLLHSSDVIPMDALQICDTPRTSQHKGVEESQEPHVKAFWTLFIDILFISLNHGAHGALDAAWLAMLAALRDTRLPAVYWDAETGGLAMELGGDKDETGLPLLLRPDLPICTSFGVFRSVPRRTDEVTTAATVAKDISRKGKEKNKGNGTEALKGEKTQKYILCDPDAFEESLCEECVTLVLSGRDRILRVEKSGGTAVGLEKLPGLIEIAAEKTQACQQELNKIGE